MKIFNRAIEINKYPCDLYKAAIKNFNDQQADLDLRHQSFEEYAEEFTMEQPKFGVIHFIHSIYYVDIEAVLKHCIENELQDNGRLVSQWRDRTLFLPSQRSNAFQIGMELQMRKILKAL